MLVVATTLPKTTFPLLTVLKCRKSNFPPSLLDGTPPIPVLIVSTPPRTLVTSPLVRLGLFIVLLTVPTAPGTPSSSDVVGQIKIPTFILLKSETRLGPSSLGSSIRLGPKVRTVLGPSLVTRGILPVLPVFTVKLLLRIYLDRFVTCPRLIRFKSILLLQIHKSTTPRGPDLKDSPPLCILRIIQSRPPVVLPRPLIALV